MDTVNINALESSAPLWSDLKRVLPRAAAILQVSESDLTIIDGANFPNTYMSSKKHRDTACTVSGPLEELPFVSRRGKHSRQSAGYGILKYRSRTEDIEYCLFRQPGQWHDHVYLFVPKGKVFRLYRAALRANRLISNNNRPPVLEEGILDNVVRNTIGFLLKSKEIAKYGVRVKRGIILDGPPGNGKTMLCRYIQRLCDEHSFTWGSVTASDIDKAYHDKNLNDLFKMYMVTFFDDIDISYLDRRSGNGKMACTLLTAMDGMTSGGNLVRIFTTNERIVDLDPAFTRPGRIDRCISLNKPSDSLRHKLVLEWPAEIRSHINTEKLIRLSKEFSFAELEAIRTFLVTNKLLGTKIWDLDLAFKEFNERKQEHQGGLGFIGLKEIKPVNAKEQL